MKNTQGKWHVNRLLPNLIEDESNKTIARALMEKGRIQDEDEANAKLIAAAPDLLEASIEARKWYEENQSKYLGTYTPICFSKLLNAIQKATE